ncbi:hypothetical protein PCASD_17111 [Puccinia coronata f. sp. avenae]|uniref:Core-binding (CB) domain-containing protein n=1 Tax=Puccinia coronata f. sp. avenae TaxID=200324 RepID=A0A2N5T579_9BASI|nr:hypothetical protein PCASD_17111 [Puccinia coronata f. sp. avenae]
MHTNRQVLAGWQESTLTSYNAATKKFAKFKESRNENSYTLPISTEDIYDFVAWAGRGSEDNCNKGKITSKMLAKYLFAIKSWHTFHDAPYPYQTATRVKLMLKASGKQDALQPPRREKSPVLVEDLAKLTKTLSGQSAELNAVADLAIVAFWAWPECRVNLTKRRVNGILAEAWKHLGRPHLSGHSFQVGGPSIRKALGVSIEDIKTLGRWTTDCYKTYTKPLTEDEVITSLAILELPSI